MTAHESPEYTVLCRLRDQLPALEPDQAERVVASITVDIGAVFERGSSTSGPVFRVRFARPIPAVTVCRAFGWRRPYAWSGDVHMQSWHIGVWKFDVTPLFGKGGDPHIAVRAPRLGRWQIEPRLVRWPRGRSSVSCGASPAYDMWRVPALVSTLIVSTEDEGLCRLTDDGWIRLYDLETGQCTTELTLSPVDWQQRVTLRVATRPDSAAAIPNAFEMGLLSSDELTHQIRWMLQKTRSAHPGDAGLVDVYLPMQEGNVTEGQYLYGPAMQQWTDMLHGHVHSLMAGAGIGYVGIYSTLVHREETRIVFRPENADWHTPGNARDTGGSSRPGPLFAEVMHGDKWFQHIPPELRSEVGSGKVEQFAEGLAVRMQAVERASAEPAPSSAQGPYSHTITVRAMLSLPRRQNPHFRAVVQAANTLPEMLELYKWLHEYLLSLLPVKRRSGQDASNSHSTESTHEQHVDEPAPGTHHASDEFDDFSDYHSGSEYFVRRTIRLVIAVAMPNAERVTIEVKESEWCIGRHQRADIHIPLGNVSKRHCRVVYRVGRTEEFVMEDRKSTSGTYYLGNQHRGEVAEPGQKIAERVITNGDVFCVGDAWLYCEVLAR